MELGGWSSFTSCSLIVNKSEANKLILTICLTAAFVGLWALLGPGAILLFIPLLGRKGPYDARGLLSLNVVIGTSLALVLLAQIVITVFSFEQTIVEVAQPFANLRILHTRGSASVLEVNSNLALLYVTEVLGGVILASFVFVLSLRQGSLDSALDAAIARAKSNPKVRLGNYIPLLLILLILGGAFLYFIDGTEARRGFAVPYMQPFCAIIVFVTGSFFLKLTNEEH